MAWSKPSGMFDRDFEWAELTRFAGSDAPRATLGIVSGRRRQGKTFLLDALTVEANGFMFTAAETTEADSLRQFGEALASYLGEPVPFRYAGWDEAITRLMRIAEAPARATIPPCQALQLPSYSVLEQSAQRCNTPGAPVARLGLVIHWQASGRKRAIARQSRTRADRPDAGLPARQGILGDNRPAHRGADQRHRGRNTRVPQGIRARRRPS
jgi:hypothetical protein